MTKDQYLRASSLIRSATQGEKDATIVRYLLQEADRCLERAQIIKHVYTNNDNA